MPIEFSDLNWEPRVDIAEAQAIATDLANFGVVYGLNFLTAVIVLVAGVAAARWVERSIRNRFVRVKRFDQTLVPIMSQVAYYAVLVLTGMMVLAQFGVQTASIIAILGATGLAVGLALQGTLQNVAAGLMLLLLRPFRVGDSIEGAGKLTGTVDEIGLFMTILHDANNVYVAVPNAKLWSDAIINYSKRNTRRLVIPIGISYEDDVDAATRVLVELAKKDANVLQQREPEVAVTKFDENAVRLELRVWARRESYGAAEMSLNRDVKSAFDKAGIRVPNPLRAPFRELNDSVERMRASLDGEAAKQQKGPRKQGA